MTKITTAASLIAIIMLAFTACKKKHDSHSGDNDAYTCTTCAQTPDALAAYDASSKGVYKGIVVGSSGTIEFNIANNDSTITATMIIDSVTVILTSSVTWTNGQSYVAPFTGTLNGAPVTINFQVDANGGDPVVTSADIPGHPNATFTLVKETSNALIECFEGTFHSSEPQDGTFDMLLSRALAKWGAEAHENGSTETTSDDGTINSSNELINSSGKTIGTLSGDVISGTFQDNNGNTITINAQRTL